jgi:nucleoside-diphosphate-sugar epimerase
VRVLVTGAAGNLGAFTARHLLEHTPYDLNLLVHRKPLPFDVSRYPQARVFQGDLAAPATLPAALEGVDAVVHYAGVLFRPRPERFLPVTNTRWTATLVDAALAARVRRFLLVNFPHVEGESTPAKPSRGGFPAREPSSVHARTRLAAERYMFERLEGTATTAVALRPGMIYGRGVLMVDAARWLARRRLLAVWRKPTWIHLLALPDYLTCVQAALERPGVAGVYNLGDDGPLTLQEFLARACARWHCPRPWGLPRWTFYAAAGAVETFATLFGTPSPLTRDFIRIGMASYTADTTRMKAELLPRLGYPTLAEGQALL